MRGDAAESYTCARARASVCVRLLWRGRVAVRLLVCAVLCCCAAGGADRGAAGAVWPGVCQSVGVSCRRCAVHVAGV